MNNHLTARTLSGVGALLGAMLLAGTSAHAKSGGVGWQDTLTLSIPEGTTDQFYHYPCPGNLNAISGGYFANAAALANGFNVTGTGPRLDEAPPAYNEWAWNFVWANGAPSGTQILVNVNCKKGAP